MNKCKTCKWWTEDDIDPISYGDCRLSEKFDMYNNPEPLVYIYCDSTDGFIPSRMLCTKPDFGCILWEEKHKNG